MIALVLGAALGAPALVVAADPAITTTTQTQSTSTSTVPTEPGGPATTGPATEPAQTAPSAPAKPKTPRAKAATEPQAGAAAQGNVKMKDSADYVFKPKTLTIQAGDTVTWTNDGTAPEGHNVTADDGSFQSINRHLKHGDTYSRSFNSAGTFAYYCSLHGGKNGQGMSGTITVSASGSSGNGGTSSGGGSSSGSSGLTAPSATISGGSGSSSGGSGGSLPSTGVDLLLLALIGGNLLVGGLVLRQAVESRRAD